MNKPNGYDEARESGSFTPIELGGHYAVIKQVTEKQSSNGKDMIVVLFDFCTPDKQPGYFEDEFKSDTREEKKWPFSGSKYVMVKDYQDDNKTSKNFKTFCRCVEDSNGMQIKWSGGDWGKQFKDKKIGVVYGEEESEYDGRISMRRVPKWFCRWDKVKEATIPAAKYINGSSPAASQTDQTPSGFIPIADDEIPF